MFFTFLKTHSSGHCHFPSGLPWISLKEKVHIHQLFQTGEQQYQRSSPTTANVLCPTSDFSTWGFGKMTGNPQEIWLWRTGGFDYRTSTELRETETLGGHKKKFCVHQNLGEMGSDHTRDHTNLPLSVWGPPAEVLSAVACDGDGGTGSRGTGRCIFA